MALKIRLRRMGRKNAPTYRIVVAESSMPRDGRIIASLGHYNPRTNPLTLSVDRAKTLHWLGMGATPTDTAEALLKRAGIYRPEEPAVVSAISAVAEKTREVAKRAGGATKSAAGKVAAKAKSVAGGVKEAAETVVEAAGTVVEEVREKAGDLGEAAAGALETAKEAAAGVVDRVTGADNAVEGELAAATPAEEEGADKA